MRTRVIRWLRRNWLPLALLASFGAYWFGARELKAPQAPPELDLSVPAGTAFAAGGAEISPPLGDPTASPRVVDFFTDSCPACRTVRPAVERLGSDCSDGTVEVLMINLSDPRNEHLAARYRLVGVPTVSLIDGSGQETGRLVGTFSLRALRRATASLAGTPCAW